MLWNQLLVFTVSEEPLVYRFDQDESRFKSHVVIRESCHERGFIDSRERSRIYFALRIFDRY